MFRIAIRKISLFILIISFSVQLFAQKSPSDSMQKSSTDSTFKFKHNPKKATLYSACVPGLGQIYNRRYWKVPLIYAGFAAFGYFIITNNIEYNNFKNAYLYASGDSTNRTLNNKSLQYYRKYSVDGLQQGKNYYKNNRDLSIILIFAWWALNIVDASVDANLFNYDISDDLSLHIKPSSSQFTGLSLILNFKNTRVKN